MENEIPKMESETPKSDLPGQAAAPALAVPSVKRKRILGLVLKIAIWIIAVLVVAVVVMGVGIYKFGWKGAVVDRAEAIFPYPIAVVDWRIISVHDFNQRFEAFARAVKSSQDFDFNDPKNKETVKQQKDDILNRMVEVKLESVLAGRRGIKVNDEEVNKELETVAQQAGIKTEDIDSTVERLYGWTRRQFISEVMIPQIKERKLVVSLNGDKQVNAEAYKKVQEIQDKLGSGGDFSQLAKDYSEDTGSRDQGGDLGWTPTGYFVSEFEDAVSKLEPGQVSGPVVTQFGVHLIQLVEKSEKDGQPQIHARHILISTKDFSTWLNDQKSQAKIWKFQVS